MKTNIIIPFLLLSILYAQEAQTYLKTEKAIRLADSLRSSPEKLEYHPNGQLKYRYQSCFRTGMWEGFYENGKPRFRFTFVNHKRKGMQTWWKENGDTLSHVFIDEEARIYPSSDSIKSYVPIKAPARSWIWEQKQKEIGFPKLMLDAGIRGRLDIRVKVNEEGQVVDYRLKSGVWCWIDQLYLLHILDSPWTAAIGYDDRPTSQWVKVSAFFRTVD